MPIAFNADHSGSHSASPDDSKRSDGSFFYPGVKTLFVKKGQIVRMRPLPARDPRLAKVDPAWKTSYIPFRDVTSKQEDPDVKGPVFTPWAVLLCGYKFCGNSGSTILSPTTLRTLPSLSGQFNAQDTADPLLDIRIMVAREKKTDPAMQAIWDTKVGTGDKTRYLLPQIENRMAMNVVAFDPRTNMPDNEPSVTEFAYGGYKLTKEALDQRPDPGVTPLHPNWPQFVLGDPTDPQYGLVGWTATGKAGQVDTNTLAFSMAKNRPEGVMKYPIDPATPWGRKILESRYDLEDGNTVLKVWTYQEIVDWAVADGRIPYELIQKACGHRANIPASPKRNTTVSSPATTTSVTPTTAAGTGGPALPQPLSGSALTQSPAATPAPADDIPMGPVKKFWASINGQVTEVDSFKLRGLVDGGLDPQTPVMNYDYSGGWSTAAALGFDRKVATPPPPPPAPAVQAPPPPPAPATTDPVQQAQPASPAPTVATAVAATPPPLAPAAATSAPPPPLVAPGVPVITPGATWSAADEARFKVLEGLIMKNNAAPAELSEFVQLNGRRSGTAAAA